MNNNPIKLPVCHPNTVEVYSTQTVEGIKALKNCFVHVTDINTTFFIDNQRRITAISVMPVFVDDYDYANNPRGLRAQVCYDFLNSRMIIYNPKGEYRVLSLGAQ